MLRLVGQLFIAIAWLVFLPFALLRRFWPLKKGTYVLVEIDGKVADFVAPRRLLELGRPRSTSLYAMGKLVELIAKDDRIAGMVVVVKSFRGGMATATSLRGALARLRASKRDVVVHLPTGGGTKELYIATIANRIYLGPQAGLGAVGFLSSTTYFKRALDRAGVGAEVYAQGTYKSAGEQLVRDSMSDANREQIGAILDGMYGALIGGISEGRSVDRERAIAMVDDAPYHGERAAEAKVVDGVAYEDELAARVGGGDGEKRARFAFAGSYVASQRALRMRSLFRKPVIGVISVHGVISGTTPMGFGPSASDEHIIAAVRLARASRRVAGVVLHVDSPGGSALASDRIHHELVQLAAEKPLVACFSDVAASGGYYIAAAAHAIIAQPTTITGSIGVVGTRFVIEPLLAKLGIVTEIIERGRHAHQLGGGRAYDDEDRAVLDRELAAFYRAFVGIVAAGRKRSVDEIEKVAEGRVWTGADAHAHGLVDRLGGFDVALDEVRARIGARGASLEPAIVRGPRRGLPPLDPPTKRAAEILEAAGALVSLAGVDLRALALAASRERVLAFSPAALAIRS